MRLNTQDIEEMKNYFAPKELRGKSLPNPKTVNDFTTFWLQDSNGVQIEHKMFNGKWHIKVIDNNLRVVLLEV